MYAHIYSSLRHSLALDIHNDVILAGHALWMRIHGAKTRRIRRQNKPEEPSRFAGLPLFAVLLNILYVLCRTRTTRLPRATGYKDFVLDSLNQINTNYQAIDEVASLQLVFR